MFQEGFTESLAKLPIFMGLSQNERIILCQEIGLVFDLIAGETIAVEGEEDDSVVIVLSGQLSVQLRGVELAQLGPGSLLGERALFGIPGARGATLTTLRPCKLLIIPQAQLREVRTRYSPIMAHLEDRALMSMARRLRRTRDHAASGTHVQATFRQPPTASAKVTMLLSALQEHGLPLKVERMRPRSVLVREGSGVLDAWWVHEGQVGVYHTDWGGSHRQLYSMTPGWFIGTVSLIGGQTTATTLVSEAPTTLLRLPRSMYARLRGSEHPLAHQLRTVFCHQLSAKLYTANQMLVRSAA